MLDGGRSRDSDCPIRFLGLGTSARGAVSVISRAAGHRTRTRQPDACAGRSSVSGAEGSSACQGVGPEPPARRARAGRPFTSRLSSSFAGGAGRVGRRAAATAVSARHWRESAATTARHCTRVSINTVRGAGCHSQSRPQSTRCRTRPPTPHPTPRPVPVLRRWARPGPARRGTVYRQDT